MDVANPYLISATPLPIVELQSSLTNMLHFSDHWQHSTMLQVCVRGRMYTHVGYVSENVVSSANA